MGAGGPMPTVEAQDGAAGVSFPHSLISFGVTHTLHKRGARLIRLCLNPAVGKTLTLGE